MHVKIVDLPPKLAEFLKNSVGYHRADIEVKVNDSVTVDICPSFTGHKALFALFNLNTGEGKVSFGSYSSDDWLDDNAPVRGHGGKTVSLPASVLAITGETGYKGTFIHITANAGTLAPMLPAPTVALTEKECAALHGLKAVKGGTYRKDYFARAGVTLADLQALEAKGLAKVAKNGAAQITTGGRNALEAAKGAHWNGPGYW